jgi:hypothetical protein
MLVAEEGHFFSRYASMDRHFRLGSAHLQRFQLQSLFLLLGCKPQDAHKLANDLFVKLGGSEKKRTVECQRLNIAEHACQLLCEFENLLILSLYVCISFYVSSQESI